MSTKIGVYKEWTEGKGLETICKWVRLGMSDKQIIEKIRIKPRTFYGWQERYPAFKKAIHDAKAIPNLEIETAMVDLACGKAFSEEIRSVLDPKTGQILRVEKVRKQIPPNATMLIFLAKNRMRDKYKDYSPTAAVVVAEEVLKQEPVIYLPDNGSNKNDS